MEFNLATLKGLISHAPAAPDVLADDAPVVLEHIGSKPSNLDVYRYLSNNDAGDAPFEAALGGHIGDYRQVEGEGLIYNQKAALAGARQLQALAKAYPDVLGSATAPVERGIDGLRSAIKENAAELPTVDEHYHGRPEPRHDIDSALKHDLVDTSRFTRGAMFSAFDDPEYAWARWADLHPGGAFGDSASAATTLRGFRAGLDHGWGGPNLLAKLGPDARTTAQDATEPLRVAARIKYRLYNDDSASADVLRKALSYHTGPETPDSLAQRDLLAELEAGDGTHG